MRLLLAASILLNIKAPCADLDQRPGSEEALRFAIESWDYELLEELLDTCDPADANMAYFWLLEADSDRCVSIEPLPMASLLVEKGVPLNVRDEWGHSPLSFALLKRLPELGTYLWEQCPPSDEEEIEEVLSLSARCSVLPILEFYLSAGVSVDTSCWGDTLLTTALEYQQMELASLLIQRGATGSALLPLCADRHEADEIFGRSHREMVLPVLKQLIQRGEEINEQDSDGRTALFCAAFSDWEEGVALLLEAGADPSIATNTGDHPLYAAEKNDPIASLLLEHGAIATDSSYTPYEKFTYPVFW